MLEKWVNTTIVLVFVYPLPTGRGGLSAGNDSIEVIMKIQFNVQNVKCQGCASAIQEGLRSDGRVREVSVDVAKGIVTVTADADIRGELSVQLNTLGYPERA